MDTHNKQIIKYWGSVEEIKPPCENTKEEEQFIKATLEFFKLCDDDTKQRLVEKYGKK